MAGARGSRQYQRRTVRQPQDAGELVQTGVRVRARSARKAHMIAAALGVTTSEYVRWLIEGRIPTVVENPEEMVGMGLHLPAEARRIAFAAAEEAGVSLAEYIDRLIDRA